MRGRVAGNLYAAGERVAVTKTGIVGRDAMMLGAQPRLDGTVARDVSVYGDRFEVTGTVGRDVLGSVSRLRLGEEAEIGRNLNIAVPAKERVAIAPGATVLGNTQVEERPEIERSKYRRPDYYAGQLLALAGAFVVGLVLMRVWPHVLSAPLGGSKKAFAILGGGFVLLVLFPLVCVFSMLTVVGLPLATIGMGVYVTAIYLAQIVVAGRLGRALFGHDDSRATLHLAVGLTVLAVASELPVVGGLVSFVVVVTGLGIGYRVARRRLAARDTSLDVRGK